MAKTEKGVSKLVGTKIKNWTVLKMIDVNHFLCECSCGHKQIISRSCLVPSRTTNVKCKNCFPNHYECGTRLYNIWQNMKGRGAGKDPRTRKYYKEKGITVCEQWKSFIEFSKWAKENGYNDNLSLDRIDNNKGYEPNNCRWVTQREQVLNRGVTVFIDYKKKKYCISNFCKEYKIGYSIVKKGLEKGLSAEEILKPKNRNIRNWSKIDGKLNEIIELYNKYGSVYKVSKISKVSTATIYIYLDKAGIKKIKKRTVA